MNTPDILHPVTPHTADALPYRSRLHSKTVLAPDVWHLRFDRPEPANAAVVPWAFTSGQYTTLGLPALATLAPRPYSIASAPDDTFIDLHIRDTGHGLSHAVATQLAIGDVVTFGHAAGSYVPIHARTRPLLLLAGGVGIAPMVSIVAERSKNAAPCHLYWGVTHSDQLYLHHHWTDLTAQGQLTSYHAITENDAPTLRHGTIGPVLIHDLPDLSRFAVYLAGPAAMVAALVPLLIAQGAQKEYIFGDGITL